VDRAARQISTENYDMSVGEVINMYDQGEININPEFQRLFRWDTTQKSRFIESLLLRIPVPPIFVFEKGDATWELIDGLQRVSTILEFTGMLRDPDTGNYLPPSTLEGTRYLSALEGMKWDKNSEDDKALPKSLQISIKRTRLSVQILERKSDTSSKYDLFQRLNSGGSVATRQELRNCYMEMIDPDFREFVVRLSQERNFQKIVQRSVRQFERQANMELESGRK
jgi:uncharacterized protein with ParB-like and HNH nuclease domain